MDGGAAAAIEILVQTLINVSREEISLIRGLDKDVEELKTTVEMIQNYLNDAEKKSIIPDAVKTWLTKLEMVAFDADNVLDEVNYHLLRNKVKKMKTPKDKVPSFFSSFNHIARPRNMAQTIKQINMDFESLNRKATELGLQSMVVNAPAAVPDAAFETDSFTLDPIFIGRDDDVPELVQMLTDNPQERKFSILAIVGMGGMGKTTLTRKVFNHEKIKTQFGSLVWVHVSQIFDPIILFKKILASFPTQTDEAESSEGVQEENKEATRSRGAISEKFQKSFKAKTDEVETRQDILRKLQKALKAKTYLLVLDDVWNEDLPKWEDFINPLSGVTSMEGNGIIITTRKTKVASIVDPLHIHQLQGLSDEECWSIIKAKAFGKRDVPLEFESIGGKIARRCQGLPLAANVVGGVLRHKSEQEWLSIQQNWLSEVEGDSISKILRLSFDNLSSPSLKKCFTYCSIFPKGHRIVKQELIELWMAERFVQPDGRNEMESVGDKFVKVLLQNSLLQVVPTNDDDEEICVMHDLVHDLASSVLGSFKVDDDINSNCINQVRYMRHGKESSRIPKKSAEYLRTLFFGGKISEFKCSHFKCLHSLTLTGYFEVLPSSIRKLIHLRNLNISKTWVGYLPESIGELHHLQTLRANAEYLRKLPSTLKYLISLRHLYIPDRVKTPPHIGRLTSLQTLTHFTVGNKEGCRIEQLQSLKNLKGKLKIFNLEKVQGKEEAGKANIFQNPNLFELRFEWGSRKEGEINDDENVLEGLQPHPNLNKLEISRFEGKRFPLWTLKMAVRDEAQGSWVGLNKLVEITLSYCTECEELPMLGHLPNLKSLHLEALRNVKSISSSFYGIDKIGVSQESITVFPALERLTLEDMPKLREWAEVDLPCEVKAFPRLEYLKIDTCPQLMSFPSHFSTSFNLKQLDICWAGRHMSLGEIEGLDGFECLPDWLFHNNHNLSKLTISRCPKLRELPDGVDTLNSLEELTIEDCPNLKSTGNPSGGGQSHGLILRSLSIQNCQELMDLPHEMVESRVPSLEKVILKGLSSLRNVAMVIECLAKSARLTELRIVGVPKFVGNDGVESWAFRRLQKLEIDVSAEWFRESSVGIKEAVDGMLQGCCHSLVELHLMGLEIWESLVDSIKNLTALSELELCNFGIEELPEWFGNLSSLRWLTLSSCKKLRRVDAALGGRLTKLTSLYINDCPELRIHSNNFSDLYIEVDGIEVVSCTEVCCFCIFLTFYMPLVCVRVCV